MGLQNLGLTYLLVPSLFFFFLKLRLLASESDSNLYGFLTPPSSSSKRNSHSQLFLIPKPLFPLPSNKKKKKSNLLLDDGMGTFKDEEKRQRKWGKEQRRRRDGLTQCPGHQPSCILQEECLSRGDLGTSESAMSLSLPRLWGFTKPSPFIFLAHSPTHHRYLGTFEQCRLTSGRILSS